MRGAGCGAPESSAATDWEASGQARRCGYGRNCSHDQGTGDTMNDTALELLGKRGRAVGVSQTRH